MSVVRPERFERYAWRVLHARLERQGTGATPWNYEIISSLSLLPLPNGADNDDPDAKDQIARELEALLDQIP